MIRALPAPVSRLRARWHIASQWQLEAKVLNIADRDVEPARDYRALGRQGWIGPNQKDKAAPNGDGLQAAALRDGVIRHLFRPVKDALLALPWLGVTLLVAGLGLVFGVAWLIPAAFAGAFATSKLAITREESHLARRFGPAWSDYAARTPRWLFGI